jgi:hypothetical protein
MSALLEMSPVRCITEIYLSFKAIVIQLKAPTVYCPWLSLSSTHQTLDPCSWEAEHSQYWALLAVITAGQINQKENIVKKLITIQHGGFNIGQVPGRSDLRIQHLVTHSRCLTPQWPPLTYSGLPCPFWVFNCSFRVLLDLGCIWSFTSILWSYSIFNVKDTLETAPNPTLEKSVEKNPENLGTGSIPPTVWLRSGYLSSYIFLISKITCTLPIS